MFFGTIHSNSMFILLVAGLGKTVHFESGATTLIILSLALQSG